MPLPAVNYVAVLVAGVVIFVLGGLWYSPVLFAKPWIALMGRTEEELRAAVDKKAMPFMYLSVFICGLLTAWVLAVIVRALGADDAFDGAKAAALCWIGFTGATSYGTNLFSLQPRKLWLINAGYNLVAMVIAGIILALWR